MFARRSEKSFSSIEISFQSTQESRKSQSAARARLSQSPCPMFFIGTLSQTLTLRAAFASSTYLLSQIPGPGRSSDDDLLIPHPHFQGGDQGLRAFHRRTATLPANSGPASDDALFCTRGRRLRSRRAWSSRRLLVVGHDHFCQRKFSTTISTRHRLKI